MKSVQPPAPLDTPVTSSLGPDTNQDRPSKMQNNRKDSAAITEPEHEAVNAESHSDAGLSKPTGVPLLVVEAIDDRPTLEEDLGAGATTAPQEEAHTLGAADALPDKFIISPNQDLKTTSNDEQNAPLFRHESLQAEESCPAPSLETLEEESIQSSTDRTSNEDAINTPPEEDSEERDELDHGPLLSHETGFSNEKNKVSLHSEEDGQDEPDSDEFAQAPLLPHETGFIHGRAIANDESYEEDEFDRAPRLPHEIGFSEDDGSEIQTKSDFLEDSAISDTHLHDPGHEGDDAPLLPHERDSAVASKASSDDAHFPFSEQPTFAFETDNAKGLFLGKGRTNFFRTRTSSSTLPHKMPRSDAEDDNLDDPSLERFPTNRDQILERVATIGLHLPEDEPMDSHPYSPPSSVLSQACSSVDLVAVKSYTSLPSVPEADFSDEEEDGDVDSLPSPVYIGSNRSSRSRATFSRDPNITPMPSNDKQLGFITEDESEAQEDENDILSVHHTSESSEAQSIGKTDGTKDRTSASYVLDADAAKSNKDLKSGKPPQTPKRKSGGTTRSTWNLDSELRARRKQVEGLNGAESTVAPSNDASSEGNGQKDTTPSSTSLALIHQPSKSEE